MAAIDKTYVSSYEEWKEITDWAKKTSFKCPNGIILEVENYCYGHGMTEDEIREWISECGEIPVMNTPVELDYFLIKYCPIQLIQDRMRAVHSEEFINSVLSGTSEYDTFQRPEPGKHYKIIKKPRIKRALSWFINRPNRKYSKWLSNELTIKRKGYYNVSIPGYGYNEDYDSWVFPGELGYSTVYGLVNTKTRSLKALIRKIKSWNLPVGTRVEFSGRYQDEYGVMMITK